MSSDDRDGNQARGDGGGEMDRDSDSVASKLSKELSNWKRKRTTGRPQRPDGGSSVNHSEPARTIKVRGHETLVVRKPKLVAPKPPTNPDPDQG
jgi:hypothetical protein